MRYPPEMMVFHREEYQAELARRRPCDYPLLSQKEVVGRVKLRHRRRNPYTQQGKALVSFVMASKDLKNDLRKAVDLIGGFGKALKPQDRILLKPNFNSDDPPPGSTALDFLRAVLELLMEHGYTRLAVGEGSGRVWVPTQKVFQTMGLTALMAEMKIPLLDFDQSRFIDVPLGGEFLDTIAYPKDLEDFDKLIYLPTMKSTTWPDSP